MLNEALRVESGLTYGAMSVFSKDKDPGPFAIYSFTRNESTEKAIDMALDVLKKLIPTVSAPNNSLRRKAISRDSFRRRLKPQGNWRG